MKHPIIAIDVQRTKTGFNVWMTRFRNSHLYKAVPLTSVGRLLRIARYTPGKKRDYVDGWGFYPQKG